MNHWYTASVRYTKEYTDGTLKRTTEKYLLNTMSFTEAEARIYKEVGEYVRGEFQVTAIQKTPFADIFMYEDVDTWFTVKLSYVSEDADTGKEKKITNQYLVSAHNIKEAYERMEESMKGLMGHFQILKIEKSPVMDVFPYEPPEERHKTTPEYKKAVGIPMLAKDRDSMIELLDKVIDHEKLDESRAAGNPTYYLALNRTDCGCSMKWEFADDVPDYNVYCEHSNPILIYDDNLDDTQVKINNANINGRSNENDSPNINVSYGEDRTTEDGTEGEE